MTRQHAGPDGGAIGQLLGWPVIEAAGALFNRPVLAGYPGGGRALYVRDAWADILLPFVIQDMRHALRLHLDHVVRSAEQRLGLPVTDRAGFVA